MNDFNEIEPMLLNQENEEASIKAKAALHECLMRRYLILLSIKYGLAEEDARDVILQTYADVVKQYNAEKASRYGPLSRYISIAIKGDVKDKLDEINRRVTEVPTLDAPVSSESDTTNLEMVMDQTTSNIAEDVVRANVLRRYAGSRIDFAAQIILMNMRLNGNLSRLPDRRLQRDERMNARQLPSMRVCLTNETIMFALELHGISWVVNKSRLAQAMDGGFVRYVMVHPPARVVLQDIPHIQLKEEHESLPIASKVCAAYLNISDSTYCDHHQKYYRVVWQNSRKDLDEQLRK